MKTVGLFGNTISFKLLDILIKLSLNQTNILIERIDLIRKFIGKPGNSESFFFLISLLLEKG